MVRKRGSNSDRTPQPDHKLPPKDALPKKNIAANESLIKAVPQPASIKATRKTRRAAAVKKKQLFAIKLRRLSAKLTRFRKRHKTTFRLVFFIFFTFFLVAADSWLNTERKVFDWLTFFNNPPAAEKRVVIVKIDEDDFIGLFKKRSPLEPKRVTEIIEAISSGCPDSCPKVLGIDILTSDEIHRQYVPRDYGFPVVWADEVVNRDNKFVGVMPPLNAQSLAANNYSGVPESRKDSDGANRMFRRLWITEGETRPTFAWQIYRLAYPAEAKSKEENAEDRYIRFTGDQRYTISATEVLQWEDSVKKEHFAGKIVILGGMYGDARDTQQIPFETVFGVQLNSTIVETEIQGNPQKPISGIWKFLLNLIAFPAFAILFVHYKDDLINAILIALGILLVTSLSISFFYYGVSSLTLLIPVFLWTLGLALLDLVMDKYKDIGSALFVRGRNLMPDILKKNNRT